MAPKKSTIILNVEQFIRDVEQRPAIWNRNFHCNKAFLEQMWDELSAEHKLPKVVLKAKWKGLRDNFRVEYKRIPRSDTGEFLVEPATFESKWLHYYALLFLTEHMRHRVPKNEQDQAFFFAQQSQDCEKTVVEPDLTNGLIRRIQDSDEEFDEDDVEEEDDDLSETTPPAAHSQPLSTMGTLPGAIIKTEDTRNLLKNLDKEVQDLSKKSLDNNNAQLLEMTTRTPTPTPTTPLQVQTSISQLQQATSISSTTTGSGLSLITNVPSTTVTTVGGATGEVYVLDDGGEVDLDLGNYERFLDITLHRDNNITTGKIYKLVIEKEREGSYLGKTVQVVPHITDAIQEWVERVAETPVQGNSKPQVCIVELGGTIGDIEGMPFVEAFRQFQFRVKRENFCLAHVSLVPLPSSTGEPKTKPTQSSVRELRGFGLSPDLIVCRSEKPIGSEVKEKISNFCHVAPDQVICIHDLSSIYHVPLLMEQNGVIEFLNERLQLNILDSKKEKCLQQWKDLARRSETLRKNVTIALVGKYTKFKDSYASVVKALQHASLAAGYNLNINFIDSTLLETDTLQEAPSKYHKEWQMLCESDGVLVPGGFGSRGIEGKIKACQWCRENSKPFLGICLGLQAAVIEFARNELGLNDANTTEIDPKTGNALVIDMPEHHTGKMGGTMRLGKRTTIFADESSIIKQLYGNPKSVGERHRHRYEVNPKYVPQLEEHGLRFVGCDDTHTRMEVIELKNHPYYVGTQYHPEYLSRPLKPSPPFLGLILASVGKLSSYIGRGCRFSPRQQSDVSSDEDDLVLPNRLKQAKVNGDATLTPNGKGVLLNGSASGSDSEAAATTVNGQA